MPRKTSAEYKRIQRAKLRAEGRCVDCKMVHDRKTGRCIKCQLIHNKQQRARRARKLKE